MSDSERDIFMKSITEKISRIECLAGFLCSLAVALILTPSNARAQGALTNGWTSQGNIAVPGQSDTWTFNANKGDSIVLRIGELFNTSFTPKIQLFNPANGLVTSTFGASAAEIAVTAATNGIFSVVVTDSANTQTNAYRLTLAKTGDPVVTAPGDTGGPLTNGAMNTGTIDVGDLDVWTITANAGDNLIVRMGETGGTGLTPELRLYGPTGTLLSSGDGTAAAEVTALANANGTYLVVVGDFSSGFSGSGNYQMTLAKTGDPVVVSPGDEGGPMTNGAMHTGTISVGDLDLWTFTANAGDNLIVRMGETGGTGLTPELRLYGPTGALLSSSDGTAAAEVTALANTNGTYLVVVGDFSSGFSGSGNYQMTLAKTGDPVVVSSGDEGGPMTNGAMHTGTITVGDLDLWTFTANAGDNLIVRMGETVSGSTLTPYLRLYGPTGALLSSSDGTAAAEVTALANTNGTYLVVVGDFSSGFSGAGNYQMTLAKTGDPVVVSSGDEGGPMTNGSTHTGTISVGDLDLWTFTANAGDALIVRMGETVSGSTLTPQLRLYGPTGALLSNNDGTAAAEVTATATGSGTYLVVASDFSSGFGGSGAYRLTLVKTGDPVVISSGDEGGPMTNGFMYTGRIDVGDLDAWTINANAGDNLIVRMGETVPGGTLTPYLRLYSPTGTLLSSGDGTAAAEVTGMAASSGTYLVVASDFSSGFSGSGGYRLTLAQTGVPAVTASGDEGGPLTGAGAYNGSLGLGDLDVWTFTACAGDNINLEMDKLTGTTFTPWIRLYGRDGTLLNTIAGASTAQVVRSAPATGFYTLVLSDDSSGFGGSGTYQLQVNGLTDGLKPCIPVIAGTNLALGGAGGQANTPVVVYSATNLTTPLSQWTPFQTNTFDSFGTFKVTNALNTNLPQQYFILKLP